MKKILILVVVAFGLAASIHAQTIRFVRAGNIMSGKTHFVTATQPFTLEVELVNVDQCSGSAFEIRYNNAGSVWLSDWEAVAFERNLMMVKDNSNRISGAGTISVGALSNGPPTSGVSNPTVIRLNFVVTAEAQHNSNVTFSFSNPQATVAAGGGSIIHLSGIPSTFNIHSFTDVWPGDADNNGIVDHRDISMVSLFYNEGGAVADRLTRGYPRKPVSTIWSAQSALAWDSVRVTYVDGDGSGKVDINDVLVIFANFSKTHSKIVEKDNVPMWKQPEVIRTASSLLIPVNVNSSQNAVGISARISWKNVSSKFKVTGFMNGNIFTGSNAFTFQNTNDGEYWADVATGVTDRTESKATGVMVYLVAEPLSGEQNFQPEVSNVMGIRASGAMFPLNPTSVGEENSSGLGKSLTLSASPNPVNKDLYITLNNTLSSRFVSVSLVNLQGETVKKYWDKSGTERFSLSEGETTIRISAEGLPIGTYFVTAESDGERISYPVIIER